MAVFISPLPNAEAWDVRSHVTSALLKVIDQRPISHWIIAALGYSCFSYLEMFLAILLIRDVSSVLPTPTASYPQPACYFGDI